MKKMLAALLLVAAVVVALAAPAEAACTRSYHYVRYITLLNTTATVYVSPVAPGTTPSYYYFFTTTDIKFVAGFSDALTNGKRVHITGNAASCPTSGTYRNGGIISNVTVLNP